MNFKYKSNDAKTKKKINNQKSNNKSIFNNLNEIKFNQEELDILSKEIKDEQVTENNNNLINIQLSNEEIELFLNEINNNNIQPNGNPLLTKKRKRNFISVKNQQEKDNFIHYKSKNNLKYKNDISRNKVTILSYNILNQIFMKKLNRPDLNIDDRMNKIKKEILELSPDIFCLQEADIYVYKEYLLQEDMEQYNILYGINCGSSFINIIAYKKDKFNLN